METTITLLPCKSLVDTLDFYRTLGFEITYEQHEPYLYAAVRHGGVDLHFSRLTTYGKNAFGACLVFVDQVEQYHHAFAHALRSKYSKIPTAGYPRLTRMKKGDTRFKFFDPTGNMITYIDRTEADSAYWDTDQNISDLAQALENAVFLRDVYTNDEAAARALDVALNRARKDSKSADPLEMARALAARAEIAVAMGEIETVHDIRRELSEITLTDEDRVNYRDELQAADELERWLTLP
jgi:hypothetical protein